MVCKKKRHSSLSSDAFAHLVDIAEVRCDLHYPTRSAYVVAVRTRIIRVLQKTLDNCNALVYNKCEIYYFNIVR